jgi:hypothetical protein
MPPPCAEPNGTHHAKRPAATGKLTYRFVCDGQWIIRRTIEKLKFCRFYASSSGAKK